MNKSTDETDAAFPPQQQEPPGLTGRMEPEPDHGEYSYVGSGRMRDVVSLITGGDSGIGRAAAIAFAREGADVAFTYLPEELEDAEITRDWVLKEGVRCLAIEVDLRTSAACDEVVDQVVSEFGESTHSSTTLAIKWRATVGLKESTTNGSTESSRRICTHSSG